MEPGFVRSAATGFGNATAAALYQAHHSSDPNRAVVWLSENPTRRYRHLTLAAVLRKAAYWERFAANAINDRQRRVLNALLDGFEGKLTSSKYAKITKASQDTATRDINDLLARGMLVKNASGGRSTSYSLPGSISQRIVEAT